MEMELVMECEAHAKGRKTWQNDMVGGRWSVPVADSSRAGMRILDAQQHLKTATTL